MGTVDVNINEAAVTAVHEFRSFKGYGVDFFIEVRSSNCTVYLQVVLYDEDARRNRNFILEGDNVKVAGTLKVKTYRKKDGSEGHSLIIERPVLFAKTAGRNSEPQSKHNTPAEDTRQVSSLYQYMNAVTACDKQEDTDSDFWDDVEAAYAAKQQETACQSSQPQKFGNKPGLQKIVIDGKIYETYVTDDNGSPDEDDLPF